MSKPRNVYLFHNGMVAVFDVNGQQMPELQGAIEDVKDRILAAADDETQFHGWPEVVSRKG